MYYRVGQKIQNNTHKRIAGFAAAFLFGAFLFASPIFTNAKEIGSGSGAGTAQLYAQMSLR